jgi:hypothetical protein
MYMADILDVRRTAGVAVCVAVLVAAFAARPAAAATAGADITDQSLENYAWNGISGTTSTSTPTYTDYIDPRVWGGKPYCTTFNLHHGSTVSSPLDSTFTACVPEQGITPPSTSTPPPTGTS